MRDPLTEHLTRTGIERHEGVTYFEGLPLVTWLLSSADEADADLEPHAARRQRTLAQRLATAFD